MTSKRFDNSLNRKLVLIGLIVITVLAGGYLIYKKSAERSINPVESAQSPGPKINLDPPTSQELDDTTANKEKLVNEDKESAGYTYGKKKVTPIITNANQDEVRAFVSGIAEDGGICVATFKQGSLSFTKQSSAFRNVDSTNCSVIKLDRSDFTSSGEWTVILEYSSNEAEGTSEPVTFGVQ